MKLADLHLVLFLSRATPLRRWENMGILEREIALYKQLRPHLGGIGIVTGGGPEEMVYQERLGDIRILYNLWRLSPNAYSLLAPFLHWQALRKATVYKTNQLDGAWTAVIAGWVHRKPVIVRAGYPWALNFRRATERETFKSRLIRLLERFSVRFASQVMVTTERLREYVAIQHGILPERVTVVPNYVNTELFRPLPEIPPEPGRIICVGTLKSAKNLPTLLEAITHLHEAYLVLIGDGPLRPTLEAQVSSLGIKVTFTGRLPNKRLPEAINRATVFVLPSLYEGHPKALIEAMACGTAVVGTDVDGIRDVIRHEETGLLCPPTPEGIAATLTRLLENATLRNKLGQAAREFVVQAYSLERIVARELTVLAEVGQ
jgi:glycosyltransferase involved in cell wall biosynthesis